ncbi:thiol protease/hemagglutinin PrtT [Pontibacter sp. G13]|uniref:thiol protease/hemagglutinin PrtT n=1 Tax=Pontibacter sp. G13 TaxID=3074898 RepID=UPI00288B7462|nr:thiol protease/hemagglutinin PrtT [Pontibacter sp. G13]WNJ17051.1 thiol protease/hemagglutinin PrtT [Pontibacter sp. G13]
MKRLCLIVGMLTCFSALTFAKHVDEQTARTVGQQFLTQTASDNPSLVSANLTLVYTAHSQQVLNAARTKPTTFFYVFNADTHGFVMVSGDDDVTPILGYSAEGAFDPNRIPQNARKWLEDYKEQIRYVVANQISATPEIELAWTSYLKGSGPAVGKTATAVNPLVTTKWDQAPYENALCPGGSVSGCVATAMAQIMKYWDYPATGSGFHSYNHSTYGTVSANFGSATYQWNAMPNTLNSPNSAVATLMYHCGVSVDMDYSPQVSGAYVISSHSPVQHCSEYALKTYFGYKTSMQGLERINYSQSQWIALLKGELDASRPILYAGFGSGGGHAFVCDGYDNNDFFHFNWGWGGAYDGFFFINALNPSGTGTGGGSGGYNSGHQAIIGIEPASGGGGGGPSPQAYDLRLYSNLNMSASQVWFTSGFSVTADVGNFGTGNFSGQLGAAVFNSNLDFVDFVEFGSVSIQSNFYNTLTFTNPGSPAFVPGTYYVALFYKTASKDWTIVGDGNYTNATQFDIYYSSAIEANSDFTITTNGGKLVQGMPATVNIDVLNNGNTSFVGSYRVNLSNLDGTWAQDIQILNENNGLPPGYHYINGNDFSGTITVPPGTYLLEVAYQAQGTPNWYYGGSTNFSNPIYVVVEASALAADQYENNNTYGQAYQLPISFSGNSASKNTNGSNLHIGTDNDFYKLDLPTGYDYTIKARLHDSYNSGNGNAYSVDGLFSYSENGTDWSDTYDHVMPSDITVYNGGPLYFNIAPYFAGETGTYLFDLDITRTQTTVSIEPDWTDLIQVYPNPASDVLTLSLEEFTGQVQAIQLLNPLGQAVMAIQPQQTGHQIEIPLGDISAGVYILQASTTQGMFNKTIIVKK